MEVKVFKEIRDASSNFYFLLTRNWMTPGKGIARILILTSTNRLMTSYTTTRIMATTTGTRIFTSFIDAGQVGWAFRVAGAFGTTIWRSSDVILNARTNSRMTGIAT